MKKLGCLFIVLLFLTGCLEKEVSDLEDRDGVMYQFKYDTPYTGKLVKKYPNGFRQLEEHYTDGKLTGLATEWYLNKQKKTVRHYKDGKQHGLMVSWFERGQKGWEINFKDGTK